MASRRSGSARAGARTSLTKAMLLPMDAASARARSLTHHLALDSWRRGHGNGSLVNELIRATYLTWFLQRAGYGNEPLELFKIAEHTVEATLMLAHETGHDDAWSLDDDALPAFQSLLALHDVQLATVPLHRFEGAERQLLAFLRGATRSPIPTPELTTS
jgi:hypothetical protein